MSITEAQRQLRMKHLGSSDMAAVIGVGAFQGRTAYDVWLEKTGKVDPEKASANYTEAGQFFEAGVLDWAEEQLGPLMRDPDKLELKAEGFPLVSHPDARVGVTSEIAKQGDTVEGKTAGLFGPLVDVWGDEGTSVLPDRILIQSYVHMICSNTQRCHVPAFLGGRGFQMFHVDEDLAVMDEIKDTALEFWEKYVETDTPPPDVLPSLVIAKRMKREPNKTISIETQLVKNWLSSKESLKYVEAIAESAMAEILAALGDAEAGQCDMGLVTYFMQQQRRVDSTRLKEEKPEIAAKYVKISEFRVLRLKKPKTPKGEI